jgi:hypothetical protein
LLHRYEFEIGIPFLKIALRITLNFWPSGRAELNTIEPRKSNAADFRGQVKHAIRSYPAEKVAGTFKARQVALAAGDKNGIGTQGFDRMPQQFARSCSQIFFIFRFGCKSCLTQHRK